MGFSRVSIDAVVAAGGAASRFGGDKPKSLLRVDEVPLIVETVRNLVDIGTNNIFVLNNRMEFTAEFAFLLGRFPNVQLISDQGVDSTVKLLPIVEGFLGQRFFFTYGHAPRPQEHFRRMLSCSKPIVVSTTKSSSRRVRLRLSPNEFAEPPFLFPHFIAEVAEVMTWGGIMSCFCSDIEGVSVDGPSEFNTPMEFERYKKYLSGSGREIDTQYDDYLH